MPRVQGIFSRVRRDASGSTEGRSHERIGDRGREKRASGTCSWAESNPKNVSPVFEVSGNFKIEMTGLIFILCLKLSQQNV